MIFLQYQQQNDLRLQCVPGKHVQKNRVPFISERHIMLGLTQGEGLHWCTRSVIKNNKSFIN